MPFTIRPTAFVAMVRNIENCTIITLFREDKLHPFYIGMDLVPGAIGAVSGLSTAFHRLGFIRYG